MRSVLIAGVSAAALAVSGCSMFQSSNSQTANPAPAQSTAEMPSGSVPSTRTAYPATPPSQAQSTGAPLYAAPRAAARSSASQADVAGSGSSQRHHAKGTHSEMVQEAQLKLKSVGVYTGKVDGIAGPQTKQALSQYQQRNGLKPTGRLDHDTITKLNINAASHSGSSLPDTSSPQGSATAPSSTGTSPGMSK